MQLKVGRRAARLHVGDVEKPRIGSPGKADGERLPDGRARTVAAGEIGRFADFLRAVRSLEHRSHAVGVLIETDQLRPALHFHPQGLEPFDQQSLVGVLRKNQRKGERGQALSDILQRHARGLGASDPEVDARNLDTALDDGVGQFHLAVELQRASLHGQGTRGGSRLGGLVDDPHARRRAWSARAPAPARWGRRRRSRPGRQPLIAPLSSPVAPSLPQRRRQCRQSRVRSYPKTCARRNPPIPQTIGAYA